MGNITELARLAGNPKKLKSLLSFGFKGYLAEIGWFNAFKAKAALGLHGEELPWMTYSFIDFIRERIKKHFDIFEYGSGNSTLFFANLAGTVTSIEHDQQYFNQVKARLPANAELLYARMEKNGEYSKKSLQSPKAYHMIIVDGRDRVNCIKWSLDALTPDGVIVLDDSERPEYLEGIAMLKNKGFKELSFSGISPGLFYNKKTSVFYKAENCLNI